MSREIYIRQPFYIDPFIPLEDDLADKLYGRVTKVGQSAKDGGSKIVWIFLMRNMYRVLQSSDTGEAGSRSKRSDDPNDIKSLTGPSVRRWAKAFNTAVQSQFTKGHFRRPRPIDKEADQSEWRPPIYLHRSPITTTKWERYKGKELRTTNMILRKMEEFRLAVQAVYRKDTSLQLNPE